MSLIPLLNPVLVSPPGRTCHVPSLDPGWHSALTIEELVRLQNLLWWTVHGHLVEVWLAQTAAARRGDAGRWMD
jgi:hypothetical protein